ncbi:type VI secretion system baseplate subunit TssK [Ectothiorhodospira lacustris]|uniref:type VI secretion system baseplate subunit TssK n=1 Tax=Ectothiorhodospira lacustris TaxID=2899127 RepID=UPI001EE9297F|nr:type VI secretion system baseplate subunit TssK [Ectothiorhodospira lacustris]MCG5499366.1 type VI secretion system baseplate subunit TssK [Ectothiorhodospira lacustris]MCG5509255.1 type VI secretion system baseplate subunit TssK [Ectothiorhodospira lacustris]MCG5521045.1 type VI secretion system baseplate subunit TssK [Ectothiorhodospira lacustris]
MTGIRKPIWSEGLLLSQQHLQQWDRYHESMLIRRFHWHVPLGWGIRHLSLDHEALDQRRCRVIAIDAVMPDGRCVSFREDREGPLTCRLPEPDGDPLLISLSLPINRRAAGISGYGDAEGLWDAWQVSYETVADEYDPQRVRELALGHWNLSLVAGRTENDDETLLPLIRLLPRCDGRYETDEDFIPPLLQAQASASLRRLQERILDRLQTAIHGLTTHLRGRPDTSPAVLFRRHQLGILFRLHARLAHLSTLPGLAPERLHLSLVQGVAELQAFTAEPAEGWLIPPFEAADPGPGFKDLEGWLDLQLQCLMPDARPSPVLIRHSDTRLEVENLAEALAPGHALYLLASHEQPSVTWIEDFTRQVKVAAREQLDLRLQAALPGVPLRHESRPPRTLILADGEECFRLEPRGEAWEQVVRSGTLSIYLPPLLRDLRLNLSCLETGP